MSHLELNIGFVSTRLEGTDGVSLEVDKWVHVLERMGHHSSCFCGKSDWSDSQSYSVDEAHFEHPEIAKVTRKLFQEKQRTEELTRTIDKLKRFLKNEIRRYVKEFEIDLLVAENAWSLPMNLPLGLALTEYVGDENMPAIAHHHDFWWDRQRFLGAPANDYLSAAFPSTIDKIQHVVINSVDMNQLSYRRGVSPVLIPNVMDFQNPPPESDGFTEDMREKLGIAADTQFILQPTRVVPRKKIELSIELLRYMDHKAKLVVTHEAGDEGMDYLEYLRNYASMLEVPVEFAADHFAQNRSTDKEEGVKVYSLRDAYQESDLVAYPSRLEGFGNAFLETIYYQQPLVMQNYEIFKLDIQPKGFEVVTIEDFITPDVVQQVDQLLDNPDQVNEWTQNNYELGRQYYSYERLERQLQILLEQSFGRNHLY